MKQLLKYELQKFHIRAILVYYDVVYIGLDNLLPNNTFAVLCLCQYNFVITLLNYCKLCCIPTYALL